VRVTRRFASLLRRSVLEDLRLLVTELITNALRHGGLGPGDKVLLRARIEDDAVRVEVHDPGNDGLVRPRTPGTRGGGYGLFLVDQLSRQWGVERDGGTLVWFELSAWSAR
jgi:anti-sigma regulatory factor (Ser/Thr protein kinase)